MAAVNVLAGPIVRRASSDSVFLWLATDGTATVSAEVYSSKPDDGSLTLGPDLLVATPAPFSNRLGSTEHGSTHSHMVGRRLVVHLLEVRPDGAPFPTDTVLGYDIVVDGGRLADLGLTTGPDAITYGDTPLPTFVVPSRLRRLLHGSCRKLHGDGDDALALANSIIESTLFDTGLRPSVLFLTGDQVYADDVGRRVADAVQAIARTVVGQEPLPGGAPGGSRSEYIKRFFTSDKAEHHVLTFGEYAGLYLLAWNPDLRSIGVDTVEVLGEDEQRAVAAVRRVLANIVTYTAFDDHEITDDWNLNQDWRERVQKDPAGTRIIANGLAAYWAFQGWGNDPSAFGASFKESIVEHLSRPSDDGAARRFDVELVGFHGWAYTTPTNPRALVMDLRTQRGSAQSPLGTVELLDPGAYDGLRKVLDAAGHHGGPLLLISPTPVFGHPVAERIQDVREPVYVAKPTPTALDAESWSAHRAGLPRVLGWLLDAGVDVCVVLSGDVHYGFNVVGVFEESGKQMVVAQLTSSPLRNQDRKAELLQRLDATIGVADTDEVGWRREPSDARARLQRAVDDLFPVVFPGREEERDVILRGRRRDTVRAILSGEEIPSEIRDFDRLRAELERLGGAHSSSREPLTLPAHLATTYLPDARPDWRLTRRFSPVTGVGGGTTNVLATCNLGDVYLSHDLRVVSSGLATQHRRPSNNLPAVRLDLRADPDGRPSQRLRGMTDRALVDLAAHMLGWYAASRLPTWGKPVLRFADFRLEQLPRDVLPGGRGDHIKVQVHTASFAMANTSVAELGTRLLTRFEQLLPSNRATVVFNPPGILGRGSEIRWTVAPIAGGLSRINPSSLALDALISRLTNPRTRTRELSALVERELDQTAAAWDPTARSFDVRVRDVDGPTPNRVGFDVVTLSNHPYGGGRAWQILRHAEGVYSLTTAEFNTYAWLPDAIFELLTDASDTRALWTDQLRNFVADVGGAALPTVETALAEVAPVTDGVVAQETAFLTPESLGSSALANWVRRSFPALGAMVDRGRVHIDVMMAPSSDGLGLSIRARAT